jgi:hypothetical protein
MAAPKIDFGLKFFPDKGSDEKSAEPSLRLFSERVMPEFNGAV